MEDPCLSAVFDLSSGVVPSATETYTIGDSTKTTSFDFSAISIQLADGSSVPAGLCPSVEYDVKMSDDSAIDPLAFAFTS